jgi:hypothetical protein
VPALAIRCLAAVVPLGTPLAAGAQDIPFTIDTRRDAIVVEGRVQGRAVRLVLDTGSKHTIVHHESLGLSRLDLARARTSGAATRGPALTFTTTVVIGDLSRERTVAAMDLSEVRKLFGQPVDGVLGMDILVDCGAVTLDFARQTLRCGR